MSEELTGKKSDIKDGASETEAAAAVDGNAPDGVGDADVVAEPGSAEPIEVPELTLEEYRELLRRADERDVFLNELRRARADFENYQKRVKRELPSRELQAVRRLLTDLLPIQDNFELALAEDGNATVESFRQGVGMIQQLFSGLLEGHGTKPIDALGKPFDPALHHAVQQLETTDPSQDGKVVAVLQTGYVHKDVVIRPARVVVGKRVEDGAAGEGGDSEADA